MGYYSIAEYAEKLGRQLTQGEATRLGLYASFLGSKRGTPFKWVWSASPFGQKKIRVHAEAVLGIVFAGKNAYDAAMGRHGTAST